MNHIKKTAWLWLVLCSSIIYASVLKLSYYTYYNNIKTLDCSSYLQEMESIFIGLPHSSIRPIGYPLFLGICGFLSNNKHNFLVSVAIIQYVLFVGTLFLLYKIISSFVSPKAAIIAIAIISVNPSFITYCSISLTEIVFCFILVSSVYLFLQFLVTQKEKYLLLFFMCGCVAVLVRPGYYYFTILLMVALVVFFIKKKKLLAILYAILIFTCTIGVQLGIMYKQYDIITPSIINTIALDRYMNTSCISVLQQKDKHIVMAERDSSRALKNETETISLTTYRNEVETETKKLIQTHPFAFVKAYVLNLFSNTVAANNNIVHTENKNSIITDKLSDISRFYNIAFILILLGCTFYFISVIVQRQVEIKTGSTLFILLLLAICNYIFFTSGVSFFQGDRFHIVFMPLVVLLYYSIKFRHQLQHFIHNSSSLSHTNTHSS